MHGRLQEVHGRLQEVVDLSARAAECNQVLTSQLLAANIPPAAFEQSATDQIRAHLFALITSTSWRITRPH